MGVSCIQFPLTTPPLDLEGVILEGTALLVLEEGVLLLLPNKTTRPGVFWGVIMAVDVVGGVS